MDKHIIRENAGKLWRLLSTRRTPEMEFAGSKGIDRVQ